MDHLLLDMLLDLDRLTLVFRAQGKVTIILDRLIPVIMAKDKVFKDIMLALAHSPIVALTGDVLRALHLIDK